MDGDKISINGKSGSKVYVNDRELRMDAFVPLECVEAIILHELCHLEHPNHSKAFYAAIHRRMPDYDERMARLKDIEIPHF